MTQNGDITVTSFAYKSGARQPVADITLDIRNRFTNPSDDPMFQWLTGLAPEVRDHVLANEGAIEFVDGVVYTVAALLPENRESDQGARVAVGCWGGRHRSVVIADEIGALLTAAGRSVTVTHRDIDRYSPAPDKETVSVL